jgi:hypothetical protein
MSSTTPALPDDAAPRGHAAFKALLQRGKSRLADLVALSEKRDPFCAGTPGQVKLAAWFHGLWAQYVTSARAHLRRIHYLLVSQWDPRKARRTSTPRRAGRSSRRPVPTHGIWGWWTPATSKTTAIRSRISPGVGMTPAPSLRSSGRSPFRSVDLFT